MIFQVFYNRRGGIGHGAQSFGRKRESIAINEGGKPQPVTPARPEDIESIKRYVHQARAHGIAAVAYDVAALRRICAMAKRFRQSLDEIRRYFAVGINHDKRLER